MSPRAPLRMRERGGLALLLALTLAACALERPVSAIPVEYDFGPAPAYIRTNPSIAGIVLLAPVRAPAWLDTDGIVYRLLYEDAGKPQSYSMSRWAAEPAALIADRLRSRLATVTQGVVAPGFGARSDYTLRIELEDFSQQFKAPGQSGVLLRARASLLSSEGRVLLAQRAFEVGRPAEPNASGAVKALTEATEAFLDEVVTWVAENAKK
jgi:cholesterol transport system auxiliary component